SYQSKILHLRYDLHSLHCRDLGPFLVQFHSSRSSVSTRFSLELGTYFQVSSSSSGLKIRSSFSLRIKDCVLTGSGALILAEMDVVAALKRGVSRQFSLGSLSKSRFSFGRHASLDPRLASARRFAFGRQSSLDPNRRRSPVKGEQQVGVPENLDATMHLLFMACQGDANGVEDLLKDGVDVNSIDLDGRTALHIAACEGHVDVVRLLLSFRANIDARDRWGSTAAADAKYYGNAEVYDLLKARGAKTPKARKTPMAVSNPQDVPEYELNPAELYFRQGDELSKACSLHAGIFVICFCFNCL
ncbi:hypothetical protein B296_00058991, partial [Ensete ventricosum]